MKESNLNTIINTSLKKYGFAHKISDGIGGVSIQNPFDGISVIGKDNIYYESKLLKPLKAFNFNLIEDHQYYNLNLIKEQNPVNICLYTIGAYEPRKYFYLFLFDSELIKNLRNSGKKSILKKEFMLLINRGNYYKIERIDNKYCIYFNNIRDSIITNTIWEEIINA